MKYPLVKIKLGCGHTIHHEDTPRYSRHIYVTQKQSPVLSIRTRRLSVRLFCRLANGIDSLVSTYVPNLCELDTRACIGWVALSTSVQLGADSARDRAARAATSTIPRAVCAYVKMEVV